MSRFSPGDPVEWVSRSGIRREGEILEQLPRGQWLVRPDGSAVDQAVDAADLSRRGVTVEPAPPSPKPEPAKVAALRPTAQPRNAGDLGRLGGLASARRRRERAAVAPEPAPAPPPVDRPKNPDAVALGKLGGRKGGLARAASLTPQQRSAVARKAAQARWKGPRSAKPAAARGPVEHGRRSSYQRGCRCDECRQAHTEYQREYQQRRRGKGSPPPTASADPRDRHAADLADLLSAIEADFSREDAATRAAARFLVLGLVEQGDAAWLAERAGLTTKIAELWIARARANGIFTEGTLAVDWLDPAAENSALSLILDASCVRGELERTGGSGYLYSLAKRTA